MQLSRARSASGWGVHALVGVVVLFLAMLLVFWTWQQIRRDHDRLMEWFRGEKSQILDEAVLTVEASLKGIADDLAFGARLAEEATAEAEREHVLGVLLGSVPSYRLAGVYGPDCTRTLLVADPRWSGNPPPEVLEAVDETGRKACLQGGLHTAPPLEGQETRWYLAFARGRDASTEERGAIALVADSRVVLEGLRATSPAEMLVLGPHGTPRPTSSPLLVEALENEQGMLASVVREMRAGESGHVWIEPEEAKRIGLTDSQAIVVYRPIEVPEARPWSAATVVSTDVLGSHERSVVGRMFSATISAVALVAAFGWYLLFVARRGARLEERLRTAEQVEHLRERAERILDHVPSGVVALDAEGRATALNAVLRRLLPQARQGETLETLLVKADPVAVARIRDVVQRSATTGQPASLEKERLSLTEEDDRWSVHAVPIRPPASDVSLLVVLEDLTVSCRLQDRLLRVEKLATAGVLASGIAHEIGTPLGVIRGRAEYAASKLGADHPQSEGLRVIVEQIDRIVRTIRALLDFASARPAASSPCDLRALSSRVLELLRYESDRRGLRIEMEADPALRSVPGDPDRIEQVMVNLLMNAIDASRDGARILLRISGPGDDGFTRLQVVDEGCGIPHENLNRVFDPFFTTKKRGLGTGLGLAMVDQVVRDHGGIVQVSSEVGRGTTVEVRLPSAGGRDA